MAFAVCLVHCAARVVSAKADVHVEFSQYQDEASALQGSGGHV